jgi:uncharacterized protein (UPF0248 family)
MSLTEIYPVFFHKYTPLHLGDVLGKDPQLTRLEVFGEDTEQKGDTLLCMAQIRHTEKIDNEFLKFEVPLTDVGGFKEFSDFQVSSVNGKQLEIQKISNYSFTLERVNCQELFSWMNKYLDIKNFMSILEAESLKEQANTNTQRSQEKKERIVLTSDSGKQIPSHRVPRVPVQSSSVIYEPSSLKQPEPEPEPPKPVSVNSPSFIFYEFENNRIFATNRGQIAVPKDNNSVVSFKCYDGNLDDNSSKPEKNIKGDEIPLYTNMHCPENRKNYEPIEMGEFEGQKIGTALFCKSEFFMLKIVSAEYVFIHMGSKSQLIKFTNYQEMKAIQTLLNSSDFDVADIYMLCQLSADHILNLKEVQEFLFIFNENIRPVVDPVIAVPVETSSSPYILLTSDEVMILSTSKGKMQLFRQNGLFSAKGYCYANRTGQVILPDIDGSFQKIANHIDSTCPPVILSDLGTWYSDRLARIGNLSFGFYDESALDLNCVYEEFSVSYQGPYAIYRKHGKKELKLDFIGYPIFEKIKADLKNGISDAEKVCKLYTEELTSLVEVLVHTS